jgi:tetratricopeptide (TPR) repeat protein
MKKILSGLSISLLLASSLFAVAAEMVPSPDEPGVSRMVAPGARLPIYFQQVDVKAEVTGRLAHTRVEMELYNPNTRTLEGELQFSLLDSQTITGFALDINGEMRQAVPVDKDKGQQAFEELSRAQVDPALLEKTQGNNFKVRVYPLPVSRTRRVVLEFDQALQTAHGGREVIYQLPLKFSVPILKLNVSVQNLTLPHGVAAASVQARLGAERIPLLKQSAAGLNAAAQLHFSRKNYAANGVLSVRYPVSNTPVTIIESRDNQSYFYTEALVPPMPPVARARPAKLGIVWDASGSGLSRDHGREFAVLDAYFKLLNNVNVELVVARDTAEPPQSFVIERGDWHALRNVLENVVYDGATSGAALSSSKNTQMNLLFSDGLINYGSEAFSVGEVPLYAVNAAVSADLPRLRAGVEATGGRLLNLPVISTEQAVRQLTHQYAKLAGIHSNDARELIGNAEVEEGRVKVAGILTNPDATLVLDWIDPQGRTLSQKLMIHSGKVASSVMAANRWVALKLAQLEVNYLDNRAEIKRLGARFGLVTRDTSLIILDNVGDYVRYGFVPPESMRKEYERQLSWVRPVQDIRNEHINSVKEKFAAKVAWWEKDFPKGEKPVPPPPPVSEPVSARPTEPSAPLATSESPSYAMSRAPEPVLTELRETDYFAHSPATIVLKKWQPDAPYASRLRKEPLDKMYSAYLDERPSYVNSSAFYLDVADIFFARGQSELGLRVLSNLAEMNLEKRQILRILAYRLLQEKQTKLALPVLQQVLKLSPDEPQSWRDLGLAYAEDGQYQLAVDHLWKVVETAWRGSYPDIELIALAELNSIIARAPEGTVIDTSRMDAGLLRNLPLDVRAVLSWDSDNTDIDLWVIDPSEEKVYFGHRLSYQGGAMSRDFIGGYGPEEFSLRNAKPGIYTVKAYFYGNRQQIIAGATTLMLRLSTGFGTPRQKDENITLRLSGQGKEIEVGTFEVKAQ